MAKPRLAGAPPCLVPQETYRRPPLARLGMPPRGNKLRFPYTLSIQHGAVSDEEINSGWRGSRRLLDDLEEFVGIDLPLESNGDLVQFA